MGTCNVSIDHPKTFASPLDNGTCSGGNNLATFASLLVTSNCSDGSSFEVKTDAQLGQDPESKISTPPFDYGDDANATGTEFAETEFTNDNVNTGAAYGYSAQPDHDQIRGETLLQSEAATTTSVLPDSQEDDDKGTCLSLTMGTCNASIDHPKTIAAHFDYGDDANATGTKFTETEFTNGDVNTGAAFGYSAQLDHDQIRGALAYLGSDNDDALPDSQEDDDQGTNMTCASSDKASDARGNDMTPSARHENSATLLQSEAATTTHALPDS
eukprot:CAMPEP_0171983184 /NCGR_PEP_ID=MMETSP0993-20121228/273158_1 /TAXON_ID=483369 /ORGANISM="non described non described, Strain CCMP2098" /LENGTH=270 /DNA_ID=CAMNT_0012635925 /DNA_START=2421 /DNA_END=3234 /DNA_ORIENTATION=+